MDPEHPLDLEKVLSQSSSLSGTEIPSNPIITEVLENVQAKQAQVIPTHKLSPTGQAIMRDLGSTLGDTERLLEEKNRDDLLQRVMACATEVGRLQRTEVGRSAMKQMFEKGTQPVLWIWQNIKEEGVPEKLGSLVKTLVTSAQLRQFVFDFVGFFQKMLSRISAKAQDKATAGETPAGIAEKVVESAREGVEESSAAPPTEEQTRILFDRFVELMQAAQQHPDFQQAIDVLVQPVRNLKFYQEKGEHVWEERYQMLLPSEQHVVQEMKRNADEMLQCAKKLLENLGNSTLDDVIETWRDVYRQISVDEEAANAISSALEWLEKGLRDKEYLAQTGREQVERDAEQHLELIQDKVMEKYRPSVQHLLSQVRYHLDRMRRDPLARQLTGDLSALTRHLFYDSQGKPTLKPELLSDLQIILPAILRSLRYIKLPDIQVHDPGLDFLATNIVINVGELAPHHLHLVVTTDIPEEESSSNEPGRTFVEFEMRRIHAEARDMRFAINRTSLPPLVDTGLADFCMFEEGMCIRLRLQPVLGTTMATQPGAAARTLTAGLQVTHCECRLEHFELNVHGSGHDWMYYLLGPYIRRLVRERIEEAVAKSFLSTDLLTNIPLPEPQSSTLKESSQTTQPEFSQGSQGVPLTLSQYAG